MAYFGCKRKGCKKHPSKGDNILRVSPKGYPFEGLCVEHLYENRDDSKKKEGK